MSSSTYAGWIRPLGSTEQYGLLLSSGMETYGNSGGQTAVQLKAVTLVPGAFPLCNSTKASAHRSIVFPRFCAIPYTYQVHFQITAIDTVGRVRSCAVDTLGRAREAFVGRVIRIEIGRTLFFAHLSAFVVHALQANRIVEAVAGASATSRMTSSTDFLAGKRPQHARHVRSQPLRIKTVRTVLVRSQTPFLQHTQRKSRA
jgi:hypothetical protein